MKSNQLRLFLFFCFIAFSVFFVCVQSVSAKELKGNVSQVQGNRVIVKLSGNLLPQTGDRVEVFESVPGVGEVPLKGTWRVTGVNSSGVTAEPVGGSSRPSNGQSVVIHSPQPRSAVSLSQDRDTIYTQGMNYYKGRNGVEKDYTKALELFREAAQKGSVKAKPFSYPAPIAWMTKSPSKSTTLLSALVILLKR